MLKLADQPSEGTQDTPAFSTGIRRTKSHPLWVQGMTAMWVKHHKAYAAEGTGVTLLDMVGGENIAYAERVLARYEAQNLTPAQARVVVGAKRAAIDLMQVPAQRRADFEVTA